MSMEINGQLRGLQRELSRQEKKIDNLDERANKYQEYIYSEMNTFIKGLKSLSRWALAITILVVIDIIVRLI